MKHTKITFVPFFSKSRAKGKTPSTMSPPLLSTNITASLYGAPVQRSSQESRSSHSHGRAEKFNVHCETQLGPLSHGGIIWTEYLQGELIIS